MRFTNARGGLADICNYNLNGWLLNEVNPECYMATYCFSEPGLTWQSYCCVYRSKVSQEFREDAPLVYHFKCDYHSDLDS